MRGLFWVIALFAAAVAVAMAGRLNEGYVLIVLPPWRAEVSLNFLIVALLVLFVAFYALLRTLALTLGMPKRVQDYRSRRQREKSGVVFQDAVRLLFEGRFGQALKRAGEAYDSGRAPALAALIAARAAQRLGDPERQQTWLARAKQQDVRNEAAALMLEAEMLNESRRFQEALLALDKLQGKLGRHIAAMRLELRARQGIGDWNGVLKLLRQLDKRDALPQEMVRALANKAHLANLARLEDDVQVVANYLRDLSTDERTPEVVLAGTRRLAMLGAAPQAQRLIEGLLDRAEDDFLWQGELLALYGSLQGGDEMSRIAMAERWLQQRPEDAGLLLALGRMCVRQRLWGKAQSYLEASLSVEDSQAGHLELARLDDRLQRVDEANQHYRAAIASQDKEANTSQ